MKGVKMLSTWKILVIATLLQVFSCHWISAKTVVFIQGYQSNGSEWRSEGIVSLMVAAGWKDGGHIVTGRNGIELRPPFVGVAKQGTVYTIALPTEAPLMIQLQYLQRYLSNVMSKHQNEPLYLVGHSAGGVLARLFMVKNAVNNQSIAGLITIASPHLGSEASEMGLAISQSPIGMMLPFMGADSINRSQELFYDLSPESNGNLLFWLNRQPHPPSKYVSVIRREGDFFVTPYSQNMNRVYALQGKAKVFYSPGGHGLESTDAPIVLKILGYM